MFYKLDKRLFLLLLPIPAALFLEYAGLDLLRAIARGLDLHYLTGWLGPAGEHITSRLYFFWIVFSATALCFSVRKELLLRYRHLFLLLFFCLMVAGKFTGSSLGEFENYLARHTETEDYQRSTILGHSREIRSDEWSHEKPLYFAQVMGEKKLPRFNSNLGFGDYDMVVSAFTPVHDILILTRPPLLGFLFLDKEYAFAFYWNFKNFLFLLAVFEFILLFAGGGPRLAAVSALLLFFSPPVQWWLSQTWMEAFACGLLFVVFWQKFADATNHRQKLLTVAGLCFCSTGYIFTLYPAIQVPLGYLLLACIVHLTAPAKLLRRENLGWAILFVAVNLFFVADFIVTAGPALDVITNTTYPGKARGWGALPNSAELYLFANFFTQFHHPPFLNECEAGQFFTFLPFIAIAFGVSTFRHRRWSLAHSVFAASCALFVVAWLPAIELLREFALLKYTYPLRLAWVYSLGFLLSLLLLAPQLAGEKLLSPRKSLIVSAILFGVLFTAAVASDELVSFFAGFPGKTGLLAAVIFCTCLVGLLLFQGGSAARRGIFLLTCATIFSSFFVTPVTRGTDSMFEKKMLKKVIALNTKEKGRWLVDGYPRFANLIAAQGTARVGGTYWYPDLEMFRLLDPEQKYKEWYNQYAIIDIHLVLKDSLTAAEMFQDGSHFVIKNVFLTPDLARRLGVKYAISRTLYPEELRRRYRLKLEYVDGPRSWKIYTLN